MAAAPVQVAGVAAETTSAAATAGFLGWSPTSVVDRSLHTLQGGNPRGTWATLTAYAIGDVVTYNGVRYQAVATVASSNTTAPSLGATWRSAEDKRGAGQQGNGVYRIYR